MTADVDVVIPTYQNAAGLARCLASIEGQTTRPTNVFVCVDGSTDSTLDDLASYDGPLAVTTLQQEDGANHGRAAARNLALPHLASEHVLLLDSDMALERDAIERHLAVLDRGAQLVSVGDVVYANAATNVWARYLATRGKNKARPAATIRPLDLATGNTALATTDLIAAGGFDERLGGYGGEDTELGLRLAAERGAHFVFNAAARATTIEDKSLEAGLAQLDVYARTNLVAIRARHPAGPAPYWLDRFESRRFADRALRAAMNPLTDAAVALLLPIVPWALKRRLIDYRVLRTVWRGYAEATR